jgi:hypothetical protein
LIKQRTLNKRKMPFTPINTTSRINVWLKMSKKEEKRIKKAIP